ncbi:response regulator [Ornithinibacillus contaminans]|uniref:response regulator n=1 Tax=Ornithinibacillus contaminans TaxID=694055 RepID=UPI00064D849D|nr:response regulator [Ornithinibacillus contaminans]
MEMKILIADDSKFSRTVMQGILKQHGYTNFIEASNGIEAINYYLQAQPDIAFLDITMPQVSGLTALEQILKHDPNAKVVMCSAMSTSYNIAEAMEVGAKGFIAKPNFNNVIDVMDQLLLERG